MTVDPESQNRSVGRQLMQAGMSHLADLSHTRQQLIQAGYHNRSLCLYAKLGFVATEMLSVMVGEPQQREVPGRTVRPANQEDAEVCNALCRKVHGFDRGGEVHGAIEHGTASVVESEHGITGYSTGVSFVGHGVGESNEDLKALIAATPELAPPGIMIPTTNGELFKWCLDNGLRVVQQFTLMDTEPSGPPKGVYWPGILC